MTRLKAASVDATTGTLLAIVNVNLKIALLDALMTELALDWKLIHQSADAVIDFHNERRRETERTGAH